MHRTVLPAENSAHDRASSHARQCPSPTAGEPGVLRPRPPPRPAPIALCAAEMCRLAPRELCVRQPRKEAPFPRSLVSAPCGDLR